MKNTTITPEQQAKEIEKKIVFMALMDAPGTLLTGVGLYAKFVAKGDAIHPILNNMAIVDSILVIGVMIMAWCGYQIWSLTQAKAKLLDDQNF